MVLKILLDFCVFYSINICPLKCLFFFFPSRFLVIVVIYLVVGVLVNKFVRGATGAELIPNRSFWAELPSLIKVCVGGTNIDPFVLYMELHHHPWNIMMHISSSVHLRTFAILSSLKSSCLLYEVKLEW